MSTCFKLLRSNSWSTQQAIEALERHHFTQMSSPLCSLVFALTLGVNMIYCLRAAKIVSNHVSLCAQDSVSSAETTEYTL